MCVECYQAGIATYIMMCIIIAFQLPLVWLSVARTSAARDSRCYKFWSIPCSVTVIMGAVFTHLKWRNSCYNQLAQTFKGTADRLHWERFANHSSSIHWAAYWPILASILAFLVLIINLLTPVPEVYQDQCNDPESIERRLNSWSGTVIKDRLPRGDLPQMESTPHDFSTKDEEPPNEEIDFVVFGPLN